MANEESSDPSSDSSSGEVISLEALVRDEAGAKKPDDGAAELSENAIAPFVDSGSASSAGNASAESEAAKQSQTQQGKSSTGSDLAELDRALATVDPGFANAMQDLSALGAPEVAVEVTIDSAIDSDIDSILARERAEAGAKGWRKVLIVLLYRPLRALRRRIAAVFSFLSWLGTSGVGLLKDGAITTWKGSKHGAGVALEGLKSALKTFKGLSLRSKLMLVAVVVLAGVLVPVLKITFKGHFYPSLETPFLRSFEDVADEKFTYEPDEGWENFNDPLHHPEHIVLIDRLIVNLRNPGDGSNPMALMEIYVDAANRETAIEVKDRESEVRDTISRTLEQMPYDELITIAGKNKLKIILRKNLNQVLTKGRVRRLFYKSVVLKP